MAENNISRLKIFWYILMNKSWFGLIIFQELFFFLDNILNKRKFEVLTASNITRILSPILLFLEISWYKHFLKILAGFSSDVNEVPILFFPNITFNKWSYKILHYCLFSNDLEEFSQINLIIQIVQIFLILDSDRTILELLLVLSPWLWLIIKRNIFHFNFIENINYSLANNIVQYDSQSWIQRIVSSENLKIINGLSIALKVIKLTLKLEPTNSQINAAIAMFKNKLIDMSTGEGKTLSILIAAFLNFYIRNNHTYIISINDYLIKRDFEWSKPFWDFLKIKSVRVNEDNIVDNPYMEKIVYVTNNQLIFDYMRNIYSNDFEVFFPLKKDISLIFDEYDVSLWEGITSPYVISSSIARPLNREMIALSFNIAYLLSKNKHFILDEYDNTLYFTDSGIELIEDYLNNQISKDKNWYSRPNNQVWTYIEKALRSIYLFTNGVHYIVKKSKIIVVNDQTARLEESKHFSDYMHNFLAYKEGVEPVEENSSIAMMHYHHFLKTFPNISGASGTSYPEEMNRIYHLKTLKIEPHYEKKLVLNKKKLFNNKSLLLEKLIEILNISVNKKAPILIITLNIPELDEVANALDNYGFKYNRIDAMNEAYEEYLLNQAGLPNQITISTLMVARGTDIKLGGNYDRIIIEKPSIFSENELRNISVIKNLYCSYVINRGGLTTVLIGLPFSEKMERQIYGRSARKGEIGTVYSFYDNNDENLLLSGFSERWFNFTRALFGDHISARIIQKSLEDSHAKGIYHSYINSFMLNKYMEDFRFLNIFLYRLSKGIKYNFGVDTILCLMFDTFQIKGFSYNYLKFLWWSRTKTDLLDKINDYISSIRTSNNLWLSQLIIFNNDIHKLNNHISNLESSFISNANILDKLISRRIKETIKKINWFVMFYDCCLLN